MRGGLCGARREPAWLGKLRDADAIAIKAAARTSRPAALDAAIALRDAYQHRRPLRGGVAEFRGPLGLPLVLASAVEITETLGESRLDPGIAGIVERESLQFALPWPFQRALFAALVETVEAILVSVK